MKVLLLSGGSSNERDVSLRSASSVRGALLELGHQVVDYDPANGLAATAGFAGKVDVALPILHGAGGEDGSVQAVLEKAGITYLGADAQVSALCFDKNRFKMAAGRFGLRIPRGELVNKTSFEASALRLKPYVLKPVSGGSSIDTFIIREPGRQTEPGAVFERHSQMLIEELIEGIEVTVPILGDQALPVIEIIPPPGGEFDYENKYNGATQELCPPRNVSATDQRVAQKAAEKIHRGLGVRHLSRTDMILDENGELVVLELNTIPGMTAESLYPKAARAAGLDMTRLIDRFLKLIAPARR